MAADPSEPLPLVVQGSPFGYPQARYVAPDANLEPEILWFDESAEGTAEMADDRLRTSEVERLLDALLKLETPDEAYALLLDLCTVREIQEMGQRLHVAALLAAGEHYTAIQEETGASATTISRVSKSLNYGADGYQTVLKRLDEETGR